MSVRGRGSGNFPLAFELIIQGGPEARRVLQSFTKDLQNIERQANKTAQSLSKLTTGTTGRSSGIAAIAKDMQQVDQAATRSISNITRWQSAIQGSVTRIQQGFQRLPQPVQGVVSTISSRLQSLTPIATSVASSIGSAFQRIPSVVSGVVSSIQSTFNRLNSIGSSLSNVGSSIGNAVSSGASRAASAVSRIGAAFREAAGMSTSATGQMNRNLQSVAMQAQRTSTSIGGMGSAMGGFASTIRGMTGALFGLNMMRAAATEVTFLKEQLEEAKKSAAEAQKTFDSLNGTNIQSTEQWQKLEVKIEKARIALEKARTSGRSSSAEIALKEREYNDLLAEQQQLQAEGIEGTEDFKRARQDLAQANKYVAMTERMLKSATADVVFFQIMMATSFINSAVGMLEQAKNARMLNTALGARTGLAGGIAGVVASMKGFGLLAGKFLLPFAAIGGALLAIKTNFMGFRDMLQDFGRFLGDLIPPLRPVLIIIEQFGVLLGLLPRQADIAKIKMNNAFKSLGDSVKKTLDGIKFHFSQVSNAFKAGKYWEGLSHIKRAIIDTFNLEKVEFDFKNTMRRIQTLLRGGDIIEAARVLGASIIKGIFGEERGDAMLQGIRDFSSRLVSSFTQLAQDFVSGNPLQAISNFFSNITNGYFDPDPLTEAVKYCITCMYIVARHWIDDRIVDLKNWLWTSINWLWGEIQKNIGQITEGKVPDVARSILKFVLGHDKGVEVITQIEGFGAKVKTSLNVMKNTIESGGNPFEAIKGLFESVTGIDVDPIINSITSAVGTAIVGIGKYVNDNAPKWGKAILGTIAYHLTNIKNYFTVPDDVGNTAAQKITDAVLGWVSTHLRTHIDPPIKKLVSGINLAISEEFNKQKPKQGQGGGQQQGGGNWLLDMIFQDPEVQRVRQEWSGFLNFINASFPTTITELKDVGKTIRDNIFNEIVNIPTLKPYLPGFITFISNVFSGIKSAATSFMKGGALLMDMLGFAAKGDPRMLLEFGNWIASKLYGGISDFITRLFKIGELIQNSIFKSIDTLKNTGGAIIDYIWQGIVGFIDRVFKLGAEIQTNVTKQFFEFYEAGRDIADNIWKGIVAFFTGKSIKDAIINKNESGGIGAGDLPGAFGVNPGGIFQNKGQSNKGGFQTVAFGGANTLNASGSAGIGAGAGAFAKSATEIKNATSSIMGSIAQLKQAFADLASSSRNSMVQIGSDIVGLSRGIVAFKDGVTGAMPQIGNSTLTMANTVRTSFVQIGTDIIGLSRGIVAFRDGMLTSMSSIGNAVQTMANMFRTAFVQIGTDIVGLSRGIVAFRIGVGTSASTIGQSIQNMANSARNAMVQWGNDIIGMSKGIVAFRNGVTSSMSQIAKAMNNAANSARNLARAISNLRSKTIYITTVQRTVRQTVRRQLGGFDIVDRPTTFRVGEYSKPEAVSIMKMANGLMGVSVTPMTSNPADPNDKAVAKTVRAQQGYNRLTTHSQIREIAKDGITRAEWNLLIDLLRKNFNEIRRQRQADLSRIMDRFDNQRIEMDGRKVGKSVSNNLMKRKKAQH